MKTEILQELAVNSIRATEQIHQIENNISAKSEVVNVIAEGSASMMNFLTGVSKEFKD